MSSKDLSANCKDQGSVGDSLRAAFHGQMRSSRPSSVTDFRCLAFSRLDRASNMTFKYSCPLRPTRNSASALPERPMRSKICSRMSASGRKVVNFPFLCFSRRPKTKNAMFLSTSGRSTSGRPASPGGDSK